MTTRQLQVHIGNTLRIMREKVGYSQEDVAAEIGISRASVIRTESGESQTVKQLVNLVRYFEFTKQRHFKAIYQLFFPEDFPPAFGLSRQSKIRQLTEYLNNVAPDYIIDQIYFHYFGDHGSDPEAVQQMVTAHLHTPLQMRVGASQHIETNYKQSERLGLDPCKDDVQPNISVLEAANSAGFQASLNGLPSYSIEQKEPTL